VAKRRGLAPQHDEHVNVTPLIDIVMCLIIFFMICGKLVQADVAPIEVPKAKKAQELEDQKNRLFINLVPDYTEKVREQAKTNPRVYLIPENKLELKPLVQIHGKNVEFDKLPEVLRAEKKDNPDMRLLIRADRDLHYKWISPLIVSCAKADIKSIHFATEQEVSTE
jgi:biopolymer transport protein ExbD